MAAVDVTQLRQALPSPLPWKPLNAPSVYTGHFICPPNKPNQTHPMDSYISTPGWFKGQIWINQFNLGRYWPASGPQMTLYVPKTILRPFPFRNDVMLLEYENAPCADTSTCIVSFTTTPVLNGTVHPDSSLKLVSSNTNRLPGHW